MPIEKRYSVVANVKYRTATMKVAAVNQQWTAF
jgi:hypothetical protein